MNINDPEHESTAFFKRVFDDTNEDQFTHKVIVGDYNVALNHTADTLGYRNSRGSEHQLVCSGFRK